MDHDFLTQEDLAAGFESFSEGFKAGFMQLAAEIAVTVASLKKNNPSFVDVVDALLEPFDLGSEGNVFSMDASCEDGERAFDAWRKVHPRDVTSPESKF